MNYNIKLLLTWYLEIGCNVFYEENAQNRKINQKNDNFDIESKLLNKDRSSDESKRNNISSIAPMVPCLDDLEPKNKSMQLSDQDQSIVSRKIADQTTTLKDLYKNITNFDGCSLKKTAINTVIADGVVESDIMLIGEAPGASEDMHGIPFCGQSGKLLDNILASIGLDRKKNVYITNTVFWRPPGNRRPSSEEINICRPFVEKHVALINPKLIILVGSTAVESLLTLKISMSEVRGKYFDYQNCYSNKPIKTTVIFHPSYLLRQPSQKKSMWFDVLQIKKDFDVI